MSIRRRIVLCFFLIVAVGFSCLVLWVRDDIRIRYREAMEEQLVDTAYILASILSARIEEKSIPTDDLREAFKSVYGESFSARIYDLEKTHVDLRVYVTDSKGVVIFDSAGGRDEGKDYSRWNDVYHTLKGEYGARTTRTDPKDPSSSILYVAAPLKIDGKISGVLTVCKPKQNVNVFIRRAKRKIGAAGAVAGMAVIFFGIGVSLWVTRPIRKLTRYARSIRDGGRVKLPRLGRNEIGTLGRSLEEMRDALEGKKYVERYVQTLTHEVKSPLSAIAGAAELLEEDPPPERRIRFLSNILSEVERIQKIVDRLLQLSSLEGRKGLENVEKIDLAELFRELAESMSPLFAAKDISLTRNDEAPALIRGERFLIRQAFANLLQNAVDFTPRGGEIRVSLEPKGAFIETVVADTGPGVPGYALGKVFDRFYSLQRPDTGTKSSGLGLSFVKEAALLHGGDVKIENRPEGGVKATLRLPTIPPQSAP